MRLHVKSTSSLEGTSAELVAVAVCRPFDRSAGDLGIPTAAAEALMTEAKRRGFEGDLGESAVVSHDGRWWALVGAGASPKPTDYRRVAWKAFAVGGEVKASEVALMGVGSAERARFAAEGFALSGYRFDAYVAPPKKQKAPKLESATLIVDDAHAAGVARGLDLAEGICVARDLANEHPGKCTPVFMAEQAREIATRHGFECTIRNEEQLEREGFHLLLAVGRGSTVPSQLIHLVYRGAGPTKKRIALVGKGVTYDSGGYSIKVSPHQLNMHLDMGGSAAVLGAAEAIGRLKPPGVEVHFIVPTVENLIAGNAYKLNEIITGRAGISVEIHNTDAEGRLILADALAFATEQEPDEIIDLATLTGACVVALGDETAGLWSNDESFAGRILDAAGGIDEAMWRMPLVERIEEQLKTDVADTKNLGGRYGGAISAALFLRKFVGEHTWAHIDLAGPAMAESAWEYICRGGTGFGVATLAEYVERAGA